MPFVCTHDLGDLVQPAAVTRAGRAMTRKGGDKLLHDTKELTPVYRPRPGAPPRTRRPGTLRRSFKADRVARHVAGDGTTGWTVRVFTEDPIAPHVEWNTVPHDIPNAFGRGPLFGIGGPFAGKFHPGTTGQHMVARAAAILDANAHRMFGPELATFARELTATTPLPVDERTR